MEAMSDFFAKNGSKDQRLAMFPYKMDTLYTSIPVINNFLSHESTFGHFVKLLKDRF